MATETVTSLARGLAVLDLLLCRSDYAAGVTPGDIAAACHLSPSAVSRYLATLEAERWIERDDAGRIRVAVRIGRASAALLRSLDDAERRARELRDRLLTH